MVTVLNSNFLQLGRRNGGRPKRTVHPRWLPVNIVIHTTLAGVKPTTFRLLVRRATSSATDSPVLYTTFASFLFELMQCESKKNPLGFSENFPQTVGKF